MPSPTSSSVRWRWNWTTASGRRSPRLSDGLTIASAVVDLGAMSRLMGRPVTAINAGIACDPMGTRVALRVDFDIASSPIAVDNSFFEAGPADLLVGKDWAMLLDAEVITQGAEQRIKDALAAKANLRILADPVGTWDAAEATLRISADIRLLGVCPSFVDDINMDVRIDLGARFKRADARPSGQPLPPRQRSDRQRSGLRLRAHRRAAVSVRRRCAARTEEDRPHGLSRRHRLRPLLHVRSTGRRHQRPEARRRHLRQPRRHLPQDQ